MIILRQKEYSKPLTKVLFRSKQAKAAIDTGVAKVNQKFRRAILTPGTQKAILNERPIIKPTRQSILRDTIETKNTVKEVGNSVKETAKEKAKNLKKLTTKEGLKEAAINTTKKAENAVNYLSTHTPGQIAAEGVGKFVEAPIATVGTAAGYVPVLSGVYIPGTTAASVGVDGAVRTFVPKYKQVTEKLGGKYKSSKVPKVIQGVVDGTVSALKSIGG